MPLRHRQRGHPDRLLRDDRHQDGQRRHQPSGEIFILTGMWEGGKKKEAKEIIDRYLGALMAKGFPHYLDPISGDGSFMGGTWCRNAFTILARMVSEG